MKRNLTVVFMACVFILMASCSNVKNKKVSAQNEAEILRAVGESKSVTQEEKDLIVAYFMRAKMGGIFGIKQANPEGKTIKQIIEEQRTYFAEEKAKEEKEKLNQTRTEQGPAAQKQTRT